MKVMLLRPPPRSLSVISPHRFFFSPLKPISLSTLSRLSPLSSLSTSAALSSSPSLPYGPSLHKGTKPHTIKTQDSDPLINEHNFTREFNIAALRVPSDHCFVLENRLRGHLLNWPRIRNIARVVGDDVDDDVKEFIVSKNETEEEGSLVSLNRRVYGKCEGDGERLSGVLYRDELVRTFDAKGYVNFRNLAKLSRPKKRKTKRGGGGNEGRGERGSVYVVEVNEEESEGECDEMSGLLGDDFTGRKWRGSTRLLLLDERYSDKELDEMPVAIKAVFIEGGSEGMTPPIELVRCKLTLFYAYWQMNEILEALLPEGLIVPSAFETVGHIAHLNLRDEHHSYKKLIAKVVLDKNQPKIQTVVNKTDAIHNDYRTMQLEVLAGNHSLVTTVVENGLRFQVDLSTVYWNSRLSTERQRLLNCFTQDDIVCDVFAGVGPIAIAAAKRVRHVYANDLNPNAVDFLQKNCVINKLERKIEVFNMDGRRFIDSVIGSSKVKCITQVVMNLPNDAAEYLDAFIGSFGNYDNTKTFTLPKIHVYGFSKAQDPEFEFQERIRIALCEVAFEIQLHRVRLVAPGKWMMCASFILPESVAFAK
ncbi:tRNA (guanine(37)-N(1))-methyltransferase 1 [Apium graveolens]|uniref:tRNA (guanine(37)-N(1))-methyltransferase 1 n=1 Tax=Apium graveolens TaxID=4045 RepID=UPI003D7A9024